MSQPGMMRRALVIHEPLRSSSRLMLRQRTDVAALAVLVAAGAGAALATALLDFSLRVPGHAILRAVLPMAAGLALAPRRLGGLVMGGSAATTLALLHVATGAVPGMGATTSLLLLGPLLDAALWRAREGRSVYLAFALAGLAANVGAFAVRGAGKLNALDRGLRPPAQWLTIAPVSYIACGALAGLAVAAVCFRFRPAPGDLPHDGE